MYKNLNYGDRVKLLPGMHFPPGISGSICTIIGPENERDEYPDDMYTSYIVKFDTFRENGHDSGFNQVDKWGYYYFAMRFQMKVVKRRTKEERICMKIKTLWNKSNFVKKNPTFAY